MVEEQLPSDRVEHVATHVDSCKSCQHLLDGLTETLQVDDTQVIVSDEAARVLQQLKEEGPPRASDVSEEYISFPDPPNEEAPLGRLGRYHILEEVGRGGTGYLFKAFDPELNRHVAIKVLRSELAVLPSSRQRFTREGQAIAKIDSPNIVRVHEVGTDSGFLPFLVMEFIDGKPLSDYLREKRVVKPERAVQILIEILDGLIQAHKNGIVHRDIKPANVLLDRRRRAKLVDFGLARLADQSADLTREGAIVGTPTYMSPEQILSPQSVDERTDIYSAGVVLYELLTGEQPFRGTDRMVMQQIVHDDVRSPRKFNDQIPRDLENVCLKAINRTAAHRYQTAADFRDDLIRWRHNEPVTARSPGIAERAGRWFRLHPLVLTMCAVVTVLCCALIGIWADFTISLSKSHKDLVRNHEALRKSNETAQLNQNAALSNAQLANDHANLTLGLINELIFDTQDQLIADSASANARVGLLTQAIESLDKLSGVTPDVRPIDESRTVAFSRLGDAYRDLGEIALARNAYKSAAESAADLRKSKPSDSLAAYQLFHSHLSLAALSDSVSESAAVDHVSETIAFGEFLLSKELSETQRNEVLDGVATALRRRADGLVESNNVEAAIDQLQQLAEIEDAQTDTIVRCVDTKLDIAELQIRLNQSDDALQSLSAAQKKLTSSPDASPSFDHVTARCSEIAGRIAHKAGDLATARGHFRNAVELLSDDNESLKTVRLWCRIRLNLALTERELGQHDQAERYLLTVSNRLAELDSTDLTVSDREWKAETAEKVSRLLTHDNLDGLR